MSRSRRKTPILGNTTAESEKQDKRRCNRIQRRMTREQLAADPEQFQAPTKHDAMNVWTMDKDGKHYFHGDASAYLRK